MPRPLLYVHSDCMTVKTSKSAEWKWWGSTRKFTNLLLDRPLNLTVIKRKEKKRVAPFTQFKCASRAWISKALIYGESQQVLKHVQRYMSLVSVREKMNWFHTTHRAHTLNYTQYKLLCNSLSVSWKCLRGRESKAVVSMMQHTEHLFVTYS